MDRWLQLQQNLRENVNSGNVIEALNIAKEMYDIKPSEKLKKRIKTMEEYLSNQEEDDESEMADLGDGFELYHELNDKLYDYQREGIKWMWGLHKMNKGGVLGDDMGLGKTIQIIAFLSGLYDLGEIKTALLVMPMSLIKNWEQEFGKWAPGINVYDYHGSSKSVREKIITRINRKGGVVLATYGLMTSGSNRFSALDGRELVWDYIILDEGHKIKDPAKKTAKGLQGIRANHRLVLTGTPLQNNLRELWSLYDFVHQGLLLGSIKSFRSNYELPITKSREKDATPGQRLQGEMVSESLRQLIAPYFLRRTKKEVFNDEDKENVNSGNRIVSAPSLVRKNEFIVWLYLSPVQIKIYMDFLNSEDVKTVLMTKRSPLVELTVLKKICDHPRLLSYRSCKKLGLDSMNQSFTDIEEDELNEETYKMRIDHVADQTLINESGKLGVMVSLVENLIEDEHRILIFSLSRKMLDIIQRLLENRKIKLLRIDGTITDTTERQRRITLFQESYEYSVCLLTTQVGGVGLTLTGADRVIIYDPSWNPATDSQAVDRAYRIGQDRPVVVYRLITCSTVEEKIYRRQVFKESINRLATGDAKNPFRYFTRQELKELFTLDNPMMSATQQQLEEMHKAQRKTDAELDRHIEFLETLNMYGISDHDLIFTKSEVIDVVDAQSELYYQSVVSQIEQKLHAETNVIKQLDGLGKDSLHFRLAESVLTQRQPIVVNIDNEWNDVKPFKEIIDPKQENIGSIEICLSPESSPLRVDEDDKSAVLPLSVESKKPPISVYDMLLKAKSSFGTPPNPLLSVGSSDSPISISPKRKPMSVYDMLLKGKSSFRTPPKSLFSKAAGSYDTPICISDTESDSSDTDEDNQVKSNIPNDEFEVINESIDMISTPQSTKKIDDSMNISGTSKSEEKQINESIDTASLPKSADTSIDNNSTSNSDEKMNESMEMANSPKSAEKMNTPTDDNSSPKSDEQMNESMEMATHKSVEKIHGSSDMASTPKSPEKEVFASIEDFISSKLGNGFGHSSSQSKSMKRKSVCATGDRLPKLPAYDSCSSSNESPCQNRNRKSSCSSISSSSSVETPDLSHSDPVDMDELDSEQIDEVNLNNLTVTSPTTSKNESKDVSLVIDSSDTDDELPEIFSFSRNSDVEDDLLENADLCI